MSTSPATTPLGADGIESFRASLHGPLLEPHSPGYDQARTIWNAMIDRHPGLIVRCTEVTDVVHAVRFAAANRLTLAVRGGGHNIAGTAVCDGGLMIDLTPMAQVIVDPVARTARVGPGATLADFDRAAQAHGLATPLGINSTTGVAGLTLGGGFGWLSRRFGLTIDNLLSADVVLADGSLVRTSEHDHADLFWAIRGGGGNFGVVTRFQYRLHDLPQIVGGLIFLPATPEVIAGFIRAAEEAPEELSTILNVMTAPPMPFLPAEHHGKLVIMGMLTYAGDVEAGQRAIAPFRALAAPLADLVRPMPYSGMYPPAEPGAEEYHPIATSRILFLDRVDLDVARSIVDRLEAHRTAPGVQMVAAQLRVLGGAAARVPVDATAFAHRASRIMLAVAAIVGSADDLAEHEAWVTAQAAELVQGDRGAYVNFVADEG
ncbi:MAG TPA: FAD-binding oxidoreductase, partial [Gemmatimonadaceae bacterium]|nr:FAD-binding oxidoreductase [Gemmatimonadaceae bacterium]